MNKLTEQEQRNRHNTILNVISSQGLFSLEEIADWLSWYYNKRKKNDASLGAGEQHG